jgi:acetyl esterase/lipase
MLIDLEIMRYILIFLLLGSMGLQAQNKSGITGKPDTSFTNYSALKMVSKQDPSIRLAEVQSSKSKVQSFVYKTIGTRKLMVDEYATSATRKLPTLVFFHGGGWRTGHRSQHIPLAKALADRGYRVFLVEYRLSTEALYPSAMLDAQAALQWVSKRKNVGEIYVGGYSAGGQMAALLGSVQDENTYGKGVKVAGIIDIDGILAFIHPESGEGDDSKRVSAATHYFGYNKVDGEAIWKEASALSHVTKGDPPVLFLNSNDERMHAGRDDFRRKMADFGIHTEYFTFQNSHHTFVLMNHWFDQVVNRMDHFMRKRLVVGIDFKTIQSAVEAARPGQEILIKNGDYREKVFIDSLKHHLSFVGESRDGVVLRETIARDIWRCSNPDDYGAGVLNIKGHDLSFRNLTIINDYGFTAKKDVTIPCLNEAGKETTTTVQKYALPREKGEKEGEKIVRVDGHQFAIRTMPGATRLSFEHCTMRSGGGDTVSPWDVNAGMYYLNDCLIEGGVDLYCPRGYALAENCTFVCHNLSAAIWHDGSGEQGSKTVLKNCRFNGDPGYKLGRYHREAQFYLLNCSFDKNMADAPIYQSGDRVLQWGHRVYYVDCHRDGGDFAWHKNNISVKVSELTFKTVFGEKWKK